MDTRRPDPPASRRDRLIRDALHGLTYIRLRDRHRPITEPTWRKGSNPAHCATCGVLWPCEIGHCLAIIDAVLIWP